MRNFMLPKEAIEEFKNLYFQDYGIKLSDDEANYRANNLVALYTAVYGDNSGLIRQTNQIKDSPL